MKQIAALIIFLLLPVCLHAKDDARLLRYPDINKNQIVFVYAGDIWSASNTGGDARQLTSHEGLELFPKLSPDGRWIAFSAEYSGSRQIWVMPATGGEARQLTWYNSVGVMPPRGGYDHVVLGWSSDSKKVLFRANRTPFSDRNGMYFMVGLEGGQEEPLPIVNGGFAALSPNDSQICFTPVDREFRSWKRYKGGRASDLWIYDLKNNTSQQMTAFAGTDQWPVWMGNNIFYASDRDLKLNIYRYDTQTKKNEQLTFHKEFDVMWPSGQDDRIVYENGGYLYVLNTASGKDERVQININNNNPNLLPYFKNVKEDIHSYALSPTGKRALFDARGDIFSVPSENGIIENLTQTPGIREIFPSWSPDGRQICYYSDATGEYEIYLLENKKGATPRQLTKGSTTWKYEAEWAPNSRYLVLSDRTLNLWLVDTGSGIQKQIDRATYGEIRDYSFSPDSEWIIYTKEAANRQSVIWVYHIASGKATQLGESTFSSTNPIFSRCGKFIFFESNRDFNLAFSSYEFAYVYNNASRIYAMPLRNDGTRLVNEKNDIEPALQPSQPSEEKKNDKKAKKEDAPKVTTTKITIDFEGIGNRVMALPEPAGNYSIIGAVDGGILYTARGKVIRYSIADEKSEEVMDGAYGIQISADGKNMIYQSNREYGIAKTLPAQKAGTGKLNLDKLEMKIMPHQEWNQIYTDAWRIFRDYFYVDNLHGMDWKAVKQQYEPLALEAPSRFDLDYVLNEVVSEVNAGHAYVDWGDIKRTKRINTGLLGAVLKPDVTWGRYQFQKIYSGENWNPSRRSPLTEPGTDVKEGDYLIAINGIEVTTAVNPYLYLENMADTKVELTVSSKGNASSPRTYTILPISSEQELRLLDWVNQRRAMVDKLSGGRIGYIYVPNTAVEGNRELFRGMYAYHDKEALIIDDRYNGGGFIPHQMINLLQRRTLAYWHRNGLEMPMVSPDVAHNGPKAMLINGYSSSGGDAFPYFFRKTGQGKLIGTRTWGGLVGISGNARLVDGGYISVPRFGIYDKESNWIIEGVGVYPDIEVVDRPEKLAAGQDPAIERAVQELLKELDEKPTKKVNEPTPPDRSKWIEIEIE